MSRLLQSRRTFLRAAGATALTLPFLRSMPSYAGGDDKRYLILLFTSNGVVRHLWGADPGATPGSIELRPWLKPLEAFKDKITVVRGLCNKAAGTGDPHGPGMATLWTGADATGQQGASGPSIDQVIAAKLQPPTPYSSIELRAKSPQDYQGKDIYNRMIYSLDAQPLDPREDAKQTADQLFLGLMGGDMNPEQDTKLEVRKRLLARLDGELGRVQPKLCSEDKYQLEALREAWSGLAKKLSGPGTGAIAGCQYPDTVTGETAYPKTTRDQIELLAMSLACDLTRVASLQFSQALSPMVPDWLGISGDHHNISHMAPHRFEVGPNAPVESDADNPKPEQTANNQAIEPLTKINQFYAGEVAYLCERLSQFSVGGGKTLLDQCVICWGNELDNGSDHDHWELPFVLIGGGGGKLKTGQVVQYPVFNGYSKPPEAKYMADRGHNDLLVTLAQVMGASVDTIGGSSYNKGPLSEILV